MQLICLNCQKPMSVPDDFAGSEVKCPSCQQSFAAPSRYNPAVLAAPAEQEPKLPPEPPKLSTDPAPTAPVPPPGYVPPPPPTATQPLPATPPGYTKTCGFTISPSLVGWLPVLCLVGVLVMTMFTWVGMYFAGQPVLSQGAWRSMTGYVHQNKDLLLLVPAEKKDWIDKVKSDWELMLPFLAALIAATVLSIADRAIRSTPDPFRWPPPVRWVTKVWPQRTIIIGALAALALILLLIQASRGFGMERAIRHSIDAKYAKQWDEAAGSVQKRFEVEILKERELATYQLERTTYLELAIGLNVLALVTVLGKFLLDRRGDRLPPRVVFQY